MAFLRQGGRSVNCICWQFTAGMIWTDDVPPVWSQSRTVNWAKWSNIRIQLESPQAPEAGRRRVPESGCSFTLCAASLYCSEILTETRANPTLPVPPASSQVGCTALRITLRFNSATGNLQRLQRLQSSTSRSQWPTGLVSLSRLVGTVI